VSTSISSPSNKRRGGPGRRTIIVLCSLLVSVLLLGIVLVQGNVAGSEFAPSHFQTREFSFYEIPFVHWQITPIRRRNTTDTVARQIRMSGWITAPRGKKPSRWHLVRLSRGPSETAALASLLTDELRIGGSNDFWKTWNKRFPARAAVVWPVVQRLASRELYVLIPELLQLARSQSGGDDGNQLQRRIDAWLVEQYAALVQDMRAAERTDLADELLDEARRDYPDHPRLTRLELDAQPAPADPT